MLGSKAKSYIRRTCLIISDAFFAVLSFISIHLFSCLLGNSRFDMTKAFEFIVPSLIVSMVVFTAFSFYSSLWKYAEMREFALLFCGILISVLFSLIYYISWISTCSSIFLLIFPTAVGIETLGVVGARVAYRTLRDSRNERRKKGKKRTIIVGAGSAGLIIEKEMRSDPDCTYEPVAFIDDDVEKLHCRIRGIPVAGNRYDIPEIVSQYNIDEIIIALPSVPEAEIAKIIDICKQTKCKIKSTPSLRKILTEGVKLSEIKEINFSMFLDRDEVSLDTKTVAEVIEGNIVLITGGGGSIGCELCRQVARFRPSLLVIFEAIENDASVLVNELLHAHPGLNIKLVIGSVRDKGRLDYIMGKYKPQVVFHAAAHKHVPIMEENPGEAVKNNIFGTLNTVECADKHGVKRFVLISTDKAVNPTNVMGATKRVAEMIVQYYSKISATKFVAVRFGNVLGSNGSVIPCFQRQISRGGPVTVTHPEITRFFMTIPEAAQLVVQACAIANGGEIFILDMGEPVKIDSLARKLIKSMGYVPDKDIKIEYTGLRPGEKLYEELLLAAEGVTATKHAKIFTVRPMKISDDFIKRVNELQSFGEGEEEKITDILEKLIDYKFKKTARKE